MYFFGPHMCLTRDKCLSSLEADLVAIVKRLYHLCTVTDGDGKYNYVFY